MEKKQGEREIWLDAVRGFAILIVLTVHIIQAVPEFHDSVSGCGKIGVWLLFLLTGLFTLRPYLSLDNNGIRQRHRYLTEDKDSFKRNESCNGKCFWLSTFRFYLKRIVRIYPAFLAVLVVSVFTGYIDVPDAVRNFLLIKGTGHFWTLPVEMKFYFVAPFIGFLLMKLPGDSWRGTMLITVALVFSVVFFYRNCPENSIELGWYLPVLMYGGLINYLIGSKVKVSAAYDVVVLGILAVFIIMVPAVRYILFGIPVNRYLSDKYLYISFLWMAFLFSLDRSKYVKRIIEKSRVLPFFGKISYSLYLVHYIVIQQSGLFIDDQLRKSLIALVISLLLAVVLERMVERPVAKLAKKIL
ncbi:acyltransferase family protein [Oribacterium sp. WCC10]|uniref:acyltransferase family protein n=1 Tax=Oribacterium sp. WCC10 TaxID=1855343 RepID=UPI0008E54614|nr:acyltransferase [Oribacterium sp. WCC10]SFG34265.1 Peptidoglycan/LPS O-acetylase OafA/YrhL, contains acyltransferase and SGNH-hydrolase domains [Oribacterium sp. WCC10]